MQQVIIAGHVGADPESRVTPSGQKVVNIRLAVNIRKQGKEETVWWRVAVFGDRFDKMLQYVKKGSSLIAIGSMNAPRTYQDKEGATQVSIEMNADSIHFSPFGKSNSERQPQQQEGQGFGFGHSSPFGQGGAVGGGASGFANSFQPYAAGATHPVAAGSYGAQEELPDEDPPF